MGADVTAITGALFGNAAGAGQCFCRRSGKCSRRLQRCRRRPNALAGATKKAGKEAKGALASFDQLNVLERSTADAGAALGTGAATGVGTAVAVPALEGEIGADIKVSPVVENTVNKLRSLFEPLQKSIWII